MMRRFLEFFTPKSAMALGGIGAVLFPLLAGFAMQSGLLELGVGLWGSALVSASVALLGYLSKPHAPGAFQQIDLRVRERACQSSRCPG